MTDERSGGRAPKSSDDLIQEAHRANARRNPRTGASEDLLGEARSWLGDGERDTPMPDTLAPAAATVAVEIDEDAIEAEVARTLREGVSARPTDRPTAQPPVRPSRRRARFPMPTRPEDPERPRRSRNRVISLAVGIGLAALLAKVAGILFAESQDDEPVPIPTTAPVELPIVEFSEGEITSASDPCTGATVAGDLEATITYLPDPFAPEIDIEIIGNDLRAIDGTSYTLEVRGSAVGDAGQGTFTFETDRMVMTREDGVDFLDQATVTIEIIDGRPDTWSYSSVGAECPG
jgi:hypothetical protein